MRARWMRRAAREAGACAEPWANGAGLSSRRGLRQGVCAERVAQKIVTNKRDTRAAEQLTGERSDGADVPSGGECMVCVHPTALAVRLSQRVATMAQHSTSMVREGMVSLCAEKEKCKQ